MNLRLKYAGTIGLLLYLGAYAADDTNQETPNRNYNRRLVYATQPEDYLGDYYNSSSESSDDSTNDSENELTQTLNQYNNTHEQVPNLNHNRQRVYAIQPEVFYSSSSEDSDVLSDDSDYEHDPAILSGDEFYPILGEYTAFTEHEEHERRRQAGARRIAGIRARPIPETLRR